jgi:hypothetical protein
MQLEHDTILMILGEVGSWNFHVESHALHTVNNYPSSVIRRKGRQSDLVTYISNLLFK